jgi:hypothetical protein
MLIFFKRFEALADIKYALSAMYFEADVLC